MAMKGYSAFPKAPALLEPQHCLVSYTGHSLGGSYPSAEKQSVYSTAPTDWAKVTHELIARIISYQLDDKLWQFTQEELDSVLRKIKNRKAAGLDKIPPKVWKTREFDDILLRYCNAVYNQNIIDRWTKGCILPLPNKGDLGIAKNYCGITLTSIATKIYNALLRNRIAPKTGKILRKNQNGFRRNRPTTSQILTIRRILEGVCAKNLEATILFVDFSKAFGICSIFPLCIEGR